ncbi:hypothetical protein SUGI_0806680 [Cryptomeria japonica]|nr:hypothetical protein SUGI_0806680 [Cryptomeria japonica]
MKEKTKEEEFVVAEVDIKEVQKVSNQEVVENKVVIKSFLYKCMKESEKDEAGEKMSSDEGTIEMMDIEFPKFEKKIDEDKDDLLLKVMKIINSLLEGFLIIQDKDKRIEDEDLHAEEMDKKELVQVNTRMEKMNFLVTNCDGCFEIGFRRKVIKDGLQLWLQVALLTWQSKSWRMGWKIHQGYGYGRYDGICLPRDKNCRRNRELFWPQSSISRPWKLQKMFH